MLIARREKSTHWYDRDGKPVHVVPRADGQGTRPTRITDAMKLGLFRSVTNVVSILAKPGLVNWQIEQGIVSALTLPRRDGENEHDFAKRVLADSEAQSLDAADSGVRIHDLVSEHLMDGTMAQDPKERALMQGFYDWVKVNVARTIFSEKVVLNRAHCYAGQLDAFVLLMNGSYAILDIKSQVMGLDKDGAPKPTFYPEWPLQLAAYKECEELQFWTPANHKLFSVVIGRETPGFAVKEWPPEASHFQAFACLCYIWSYFKKCTPGQKAA